MCFEDEFMDKQSEIISLYKKQQVLNRNYYTYTFIMMIPSL